MKKGKEELIIKFLNSQCSANDLKKIEIFLREEDFQKELESALFQRWNGLNGGELNENHEKILEKIHTRIKETDGASKDTKIRKLDFAYVAKFAASILIIISVLFSVYFLIEDSDDRVIVETKEMLIKETGFGEKLTVVLRDNTKVILNSGSSLKYSNSLASDQIRKVILSGEAYFEVNHNDKPFKVVTELGETTVLGTKFSVSNRGESLDVILAEGKVEVANLEKDQSIILAPGNMAQLSRSNGQIIVSKVDISHALAWNRGIIHFKDESLGDILQTLEEWYAVDIKVDEAVNKKISLSGEFNNESLSNILSGLAFSLNLQFKINDKSVEIKK